MAILLLCAQTLLAGLSLGAFFHFSFGLALTLGLFAVSFFLFVMNGAGFSLQVSGTIYLALALIGALGAAALKKIHLLRHWPWREFGLFSICLVVPILIRGGLDFPHLWDEFTHWALMPKQYVLFNSLSSGQMPWTWLATYTPGWTALLAQPFSVLQIPFDERLGFWVGVWAAFLLLFVIEGFVRAQSKLNSGSIWLMSVVIWFVTFSGRPFPFDMLIETPLYALTTCFFLVLFQPNANKDLSRWWLAGGLLIFGFLAKKSLAILILPLMGALLLERAWSWQRRIFLASAALTLLCCTHWYRKWQVSDFVELWQAGGNLTERFFERPTVLADFALNFVKHFLRDFPVPFLALYGFYLSWKNGQRSQVCLISLTFALYVLSLLFMYYVSFSQAEALVLRSFHRYLSVLTFPLRALGLLWCLQFCSIWVEKLNQLRWQKAIAVLFFLGIVLANSHFHMKLKAHPFKSQSEVIKQIAGADFLSSHRGAAVINPQSESAYRLNYEGIDKKQVAFRLEAKVLEEPVKGEDLASLLQEYDFIWVDQLRLENFTLCKDVNSPVLLLRQNDHVECRVLPRLSGL